VIFLISGIAENNSRAFRFAGSRIRVGGRLSYRVLGFRWSLFFMAEYAAMVVVTAVATTLYLGGWYFPGVYRLTEAHGYHNCVCCRQFDRLFLLRRSVAVSLFLAALDAAAFRYDQLMDLGWKCCCRRRLSTSWFRRLPWSRFRALTAGMEYTRRDSINAGLNLTPAGQGDCDCLGVANLFLTAAILSLINLALS